MSAPLNLARRPFRNERLPTVALALGCVALGALTVRHAFLARDLMPGRVRDVESRVLGLEREIDSLRAESAELRRLEAPPQALKEWAALKDLVDRRAFSWTGLLSALERTLPPGVRLVSIAPGGGGSRAGLSLVAVGQRTDDALALLAALQASPDFEGAFVDSFIEGRQGVDIFCTVRYEPRTRAEGGR